MAQNKIFAPSIENAELLKALLTKSEKTYEDEIVNLPSQDKKDIAELYKSRWENVKEKFDTKEIYTSLSAQQYIDALFREIVKANPLLAVNNVQCYFSRSGIPNASYIGEGIILFNMGLFSRLDNESQAAFILCHEIAHYYLNHSENSIAAYVTKLNSDDIQSKLRSIKKMNMENARSLKNY